MIKHHTKTKGDTGVGFVIASLLSNGIQVAIPLSEHLPFDLIGIYPDGLLKKISVKYRKSVNYRLNIAFKSTYSDSKGIHINSIDKNEIDLFAVYCPDTQQVYYFDHKKFNKGITLDIRNVKSRKSTNLANNYISPIV